MFLLATNIPAINGIKPSADTMLPTKLYMLSSKFVQEEKYAAFIEQSVSFKMAETLH